MGIVQYLIMTFVPLSLVSSVLLYTGAGHKLRERAGFIVCYLFSEVGFTLNGFTVSVTDLVCWLICAKSCFRLFAWRSERRKRETSGRHTTDV